jgi:hypothetical protein
MLQIGGGTYYGSGTTETISGMTDVLLTKSLYFAGKSSTGNKYNWAPVMKGTFYCDMQPYPGNAIE